MLLRTATNANYACVDLFDRYTNFNLHDFKVPFLSKKDFNSPEDLSVCLHEFCHHYCLESDLGDLLLLTAIKWITEKSGSKKINEYEFYGVMEHLIYLIGAYIPFFEGLAMFSQLDYVSSDIEAASPLYAFTGHLLSRKTDDIEIIKKIPDNLKGSISYIRNKGVKELLLFNNEMRLSPYFVGYLYFKNLQQYLSQRIKHFKNSEIFLIFCCNYFFNVWPSISLSKLFSNKMQSYQSWKILEGADSLLRKSSTKNILKGINKIINYPDNSTIDYLNINWFKLLQNGTLENLEHLIDRIHNLASLLKFPEESEIDWYEVLVDAIIVANLVTLKSLSLKLVSYKHNKETNNPYTVLLCNPFAGIYSVSYLSIDKFNILKNHAEKNNLLLNTNRFKLPRNNDELRDLFNYTLINEKRFVECEIKQCFHRGLSKSIEILSIGPITGLVNCGNSDFEKNLANELSENYFIKSISLKETTQPVRDLFASKQTNDAVLITTKKTMQWMLKKILKINDNKFINQFIVHKFNSLNCSTKSKNLIKNQLRKSLSQEGKKYESDSDILKSLPIIDRWRLNKIFYNEFSF